MKWTQAAMSEVAEEERAGLGLAPHDAFNPYALCDAHGISVYSIKDLSGVSTEAVEHFSHSKSGSWSAALIPVGTARIIVENPAHHSNRRRTNISHELGHHLLEHPFNGVLLGESHAEAFAANLEKQATFMAGELLIPKAAANKAAFSDWTNEQVAEHFGVSTQFAQMQMKGPRVYAQRSRALHRRGQLS